ncbi:hypothetical protein H1R20_g9814, partial [Candolleomyces eurysporus]
MASIIEDRGFPTLIVACGSIVHHDQGIGATRVSHAIEGLLPFLDLTEDSLLGDMKTHSYAHIAKTKQEAHRVKCTEKGKGKEDAQSSGDDDNDDDEENDILSTSAGTADDDFMAQVVTLGDNSLSKEVCKAQGVPESVILKWDYKLLRNMIKVVLTARFHEFSKCFSARSLWLISFIGLTGVSWESEAYLTWDKIVSNMATAGVAIKEWPVGLVFLGQIPSKSSGGKSKQGLKDFGIDVARRIAIAVRDGDFKVVRHDPAKLQNKKAAVFQEEAPPVGHNVEQPCSQKREILSYSPLQLDGEDY